MSVELEIKKAVKQYKDFRAVDEVDIKVEPGEFFTLLGPSGCGKTTLLRMIAGFNSIDGGEIYFNGKLINHVVPHKRNIGMVFQNYAIFPHLTVMENVAYGLKERKCAKSEIQTRVDEALDMVKMQEYRDRQPSQLSGGQQQRIALARAIVIRPDILLMDEPLSNLDAKLRVEMRTTIKRLQNSLGITTIYVTHDQEEALAVSDRIAVMNQGKVQQIGVPEDIYTSPGNTFVANFIGTSNFLSGSLKQESGDTYRLQIDGYSVPVTTKLPYEGAVQISVRPGDFQIRSKGEEGLPARIVMRTFLGESTLYFARLQDGQEIEIKDYRQGQHVLYSPDEEVSVSIRPQYVSLFDESGERSLT